jgi:hypothetical protein
MKRNWVLWSLLVVMLLGSPAWAVWVDSLDHASGSYTYNVAPTAGGNDVGHTTMTFDSTTGTIPGADLVDGGGLYSYADLAGNKSSKGWSSHTYFSNASTSMNVIFNLNSPVTVQRFYIQFSVANSNDALPSSVKFYTSSDNSNWILQGEVTAGTSCSDDNRDSYFLLDLGSVITTSNVKIEITRSSSHNIRLGEVEFQRSVALVDMLDDASGYYTYSVAPTLGGNDVGKTAVRFISTEGFISNGDLVDNAGLYSNAELVGNKASPAWDHHVFISGSDSGTGMNVIFQLDNPVLIQRFYAQFSTASTYDVVPTSVTFSTSDDGSTWTVRGTAKPLVCSDNNGTSYYEYYIGEAVSTVWVKVDVVKTGSYQLRWDEVEFQGPQANPRAEKPSFSIAGPYISGPTEVTISSATAGASIYYTLNGETPTVTNDELYTAGYKIMVNDGTKLKAIAVADGYSQSYMTSMTYVLKTIPVLAWGGISYKNASLLDKYQIMRDCGFTLALQWGYPTRDDALSVLNDARDAGIKLLIKGFEGVDAVKSHSAFEGYPVTDEPSQNEFSGLATEVQNIMNVDPDHWCYINLYPLGASLSQLGSTSYESYIDSFINTVPVELLSFDQYPITTSGISANFYQNLEIISSKAKAKGIPFWAFALSSAYNDRPVPTIEHLRFQMFSNLVYGAQGLQYFSYTQPSDTENEDFIDAPIDSDGKQTATWYVVKQMNTEIKGLSPVFLGAIVKSVGHTGSLPTGTTAYADSAPITSLTTSGSSGAVVSRLVNGHTWYLAVVNRDINNTMTLNVNVDASRGISTVSKTGIVTPLSGSSFTTTVGKADIVVFKWAAIPGDANLDGAVNVSDLSVLAAYYNTSSGATWAMGDFDGDHDVDVADLSLLAANYNYGSASTLSWAEAYAQAFGTTNDADETTDASADDSEDTTSSVCSSLGLSLIAGLAMLGLMIVKMEE